MSSLALVREAMQKATSAMLAAGGIVHAAEVRAIRGTKKKQLALRFVDNWNATLYT